MPRQRRGIKPPFTQGRRQRFALTTGEMPNKKHPCLSFKRQRRVRRPLRYHSRCRATRPLAPTIRGHGQVTARCRPRLRPMAIRRLLRSDTHTRLPVRLAPNGGSLCAASRWGASPSSHFICVFFLECRQSITNFSPCQPCPPKSPGRLALNSIIRENALRHKHFALKGGLHDGLKRSPHKTWHIRSPQGIDGAGESGYTEGYSAQRKGD